MAVFFGPRAYPSRDEALAHFRTILAGNIEQAHAFFWQRCFDQLICQSCRSMPRIQRNFNSLADGWIHAAVSNRHDRCLEMAITLGGDVNSTNNSSGEKPLHVCTHRDHIDLRIFNQLVAAGADIEDVNWEGCTPLHVLFRYRQYSDPTEIDLAKALIEAGANVNNSDVDAVSILESAANSKNAAGMKLLVSAGANVNHTDKYGGSPLKACLDNVELVKILLAGPNRLDLHTPGQRDALVTAVDRNYIDTVEALIADQFSLADHSLICYARSAEMVRLLARYGADIFPSPADRLYMQGLPWRPMYDDLSRYIDSKIDARIEIQRLQRNVIIRTCLARPILPPYSDYRIWRTIGMYLA